MNEILTNHPFSEKGGIFLCKLYKFCLWHSLKLWEGAILTNRRECCIINLAEGKKRSARRFERAKKYRLGRMTERRPEGEIEKKKSKIYL